MNFAKRIINPLNVAALIVILLGLIAISVS